MTGCLTPFQKIGALLAGAVLLVMLGEGFLDGVIRFFEGALVLAAGVAVLAVLMRLVTRPG
jgi:hypothetical protein